MEGTDSLVSLRKIYKYSKAEAGHLKDLLAVESPLQIRLEFEKNHEWHKKRFTGNHEKSWK